MNLNQINEKWEYKFDGRKDRWHVLDAKDPVIKGDCEDYSLTVLYYVVCDGDWKKFLKMIITGDAQIHFVKTSQGIGHAVMYVKDYGWIDNWSKKFIETRSGHLNSFGHKHVKRFWFTTVLYRLAKGAL